MNRVHPITSSLLHDVEGTAGSLAALGLLQQRSLSNSQFAGLKYCYYYDTKLSVLSGTNVRCGLCGAIEALCDFEPLHWALQLAGFNATLH
jgi:hypothetical protein